MSAVCRRQDAIVLRPMQVQDFPAVLQVQQHCYPPSLIESRDALASRHRLSPDTCWVAERPGQLLGYVFAHPWTAGRPPSLNRPLERLPDAVDTLFIHDLALHPDARGHGLGPRLVQTVLGQGRRRGLRQARLVAVQGAAIGNALAISLARATITPAGLTAKTRSACGAPCERRVNAGRVGAPKRLCCKEDLASPMAKL